MAGTRAAEWLGIAPEYPLGLQTLPYGSYSAPHHPATGRVGVAIGDRVLDLTTASERLLRRPSPPVQLGQPGRIPGFRRYGLGADPLRDHRLAVPGPLPRAVQDLLVPAADAEHAPALHGRRLRRLLLLRAPRDERRPDLPAGCRAAAAELAAPAARLSRPGGDRERVRHPGAAAVRPVQADRVRPCPRSARQPGSTSRPSSASSWASRPSSANQSPQPVRRARIRVCLVNDWSARDIQAWESIPLGPFLGKSFGTTVSPWVVPLAALEHARVRPPSPDTDLLPYLAESADWGLDIDFEVTLNGHVISRPPYATMHWSPAQMLAHLTVNGACAPHWGPVRLRHRQRPRGRSARLADRAGLERRRTAGAAGRKLPRLAARRRRAGHHRLRRRAGGQPRPPGRGPRPDHARPGPHRGLTAGQRPARCCWTAAAGLSGWPAASARSAGR